MAWRSQNVSTTPYGRGFHEKAATVNYYFLAVSPTKMTADQREAPQRPAVFLSKKGFFLPSPTRPASIRTLCWSIGSGASWSPSS
jgi:hypothetical protein